MLRKILLFLLLPVLLAGQQKFNVDFDYARFYSGNEFSTVEFYYSFAKNSMTQIESGETKKVVGRLKISILDSTESNELVNKQWNFEAPLSPTEASGDQKLTGLVRFFLSPGSYTCILKGYDAADKSGMDSVSFGLTIPSYVNDDLLISDIQLAASIAQNSNNENSPFYKNTLEVVPNPSSLYGHGVPVMFFYYEIYNADANKQAEYLTVNYNLINSSGNEAYSKTKFISRVNGSLVDVGAIKVNQLMTGQYNFIVTVKDTLSGLSASSNRKIFVYNPDLLDTNQIIVGETDFLSSKYLTMSEEELDKEFDEARYIASMAEKDDWKKLSSVEAKRKFLFDFWNMRDENPGTQINETQIAYLERVKYSNKEYADLSQKEGWKTDRGRVYVLFGPPSEIDRYPYDVETVPYEIWKYDHIEGGVVFVFADYTGFSSYKLLHSTKRGELQDTNWKSKISK